MKQRLQKLLAAAGICSRRAAETYITAGRVTVNGQVAALGDGADPETDRVELDGKPVALGGQEFRYLMLHKPVGYVSTMSDEQGRRTVRDLTADVGVRVYPVGRLDLNSSGLLLMTNDGELAHRLMHPRYEVEKTYLVGVRGDAAAALPILRGRMELDGVTLSPAKVDFVKSTPDGAVLRFVIHEGRNRQVRRMCEKGGLQVSWLRRVAEGKLQLGALERGAWRDLNPDEIAYLKALVKVEKE
ncbi:MAG: rRNA pseudouridine synthase [Ruminococcaceae bacterium]|nr:rRNA pseudouridine synthase [Oscillospiraceae bacterium]